MVLSESTIPGCYREGWDLLMKYDTLSTRQFLGM
jgi:hypothetical protein